MNFNVPTEDCFIGRQIEAYCILKHLANHRWVSVIGIAGIGKSALIKVIANYIHDRNFYDYVIYTNINNDLHIDEIKTKLMKQFGFESFETLEKRLLKTSVLFIIDNYN